jgi:ATP-binding cassette, subfamily C, bacterial
MGGRDQLCNIGSAPATDTSGDRPVCPDSRTRSALREEQRRFALLSPIRIRNATFPSPRAGFALASVDSPISLSYRRRRFSGPALLTVNTSSTTFGTLRRFVATVVAIAPRPAATAVLVTLAASALEGLGLLVLAPLLQLVGVDAQPGPVSHIVRAFAAAFRVAGLRATLGNVLLLYVVITLLQSLLQRRQAVLSAVVQHHVVTALRNRLYRAVAGMRWVDFARTRSSDYTQMLTEEVDRVGTATSYLIDLLVTGLTAVVYLGLAYRVSPSMTSLVLASGAVLALLMRGKIGEAQAGGVDLSTSWSRLYAAISEHLGSLKIAKSFGAIPRHAEMFAHASAEVGEISVANVRSYSRLRQRLSAGSAVMLAVVVYVSYVVLAI